MLHYELLRHTRRAAMVAAAATYGHNDDAMVAVGCQYITILHYYIEIAIAIASHGAAITRRMILPLLLLFTVAAAVERGSRRQYFATRRVRDCRQAHTRTAAYCIKILRIVVYCRHDGHCQYYYTTRWLYAYARYAIVLRHYRRRVYCY